MSGDTIVVELQERTVIRKGLQHLRASGMIPAVIHDHGKTSIHVMGDFIQLSKVYGAAGKHHPVQLTVGKQQHLALIKDVDFEPAKHQMRHIVFQAIKQNEEVEAEVPIVFKEVEIPAEKLSLLVLKQLDRVEVKALPSDLPDELEIDPSSLANVGDHLTVADLHVPEGVTVVTDPTAQVAIVEMPKDQIAEADEAAAALAEDAGVTAEEEPAEEEGETPAEEGESGEEE
ncbi:MAG TPA: 50S ribosomal protein L25 [Candidatus Saccharimonadales bacterium]|nr:50S ribosomal protein L25 [Candidatus Saccharimonadales bacterium]